MYEGLQVLTVMLVAAAMGLALAHALELPGKKRLDRDTYLAVQPIYYPGFTIGGGISEAGGVLLTALLLILTPAATTAFWLVLIALAGMLAMQAVFWIFTQPVNRYWAEGQRVGAFGTAFFGLDKQRQGPDPEWAELRDRWEYSHVARAVLTGISLLALVVSLVVHS